MRNLDKVGEDVGKDTAEVVEDSEEDGVVDKVTNTGGEEDDNDKEEVVDKVREAPFWNVLFPYGYCPNSFSPPPCQTGTVEHFFGPNVFICFFPLHKLSWQLSLKLQTIQASPNIPPHPPTHPPPNGQWRQHISKRGFQHPVVFFLNSYFDPTQQCLFIFFRFENIVVGASEA